MAKKDENAEDKQQTVGADKGANGERRTADTGRKDSGGQTADADEKPDGKQKVDVEKKDDGKRTASEAEKKAKRKLIPPFIMLTAGAMAGFLLIRGEYELHELLLIWFLVLLGFYILGCIFKYALDRFDRQNAPQEPDEGEVIEKEPEETEAEG